MPNIHLHRTHSLGLAKARKLAWKWAEDVEKDFDMECTVEEGDDSDTVTFTRPGVSGTLEVSGTHFELDAKLGMLLGAFAKTIEGKIEANLDALLAGDAGGKAAKKAAAPAAKRASKKG